MIRERIGIPPGCECMAWRMAWRPSLHPRHLHDELECNLGLRGSATYLIGDQRAELAAGTLLWLLPGQEHQIVARSRDHVMDIAVFSPALVERTAGALADQRLLAQRSDEPLLRRLALSELRELDLLGRQVARAEDQPALRNAAGAHLLIAAWTAFHQRARAVLPPSLPPAVARTVELLGRTPGATRSALARAVGLSPGRLGRLFRSAMGESLVEFRNRLRTDRFLHLASGGMPLLAAAQTAGFGSYTQCHSVITAATGRTPRRAVAELPAD